MSKDKYEIYPFTSGDFGQPKIPKIMLHEREKPDSEAQFAMELLARLAVHQVETDGEDAAGRQKVRILPPDVAVKRACDIASAAYEAFRQRGWMIEIPSIDDLREQIKEREDKQEN